MYHSYSMNLFESKLISSPPSSHAHHLPATPWSGSEPSYLTDVYIGTKVDAREDNKVRLPKFEACKLCAIPIAYVFSFMAHPETLLPMPQIDDPVERFVSVVKFYLSGWHIKPPYVKLLAFLQPNHANIIQRRQKTPQSHPRRDLYVLLGLPRQNSRLLHRRTNVTSPTQVLLLLHGTRASHTNRRYTKTEKQISGKFGGEHDGGSCSNEVFEQRRKIVCFDSNMPLPC